ncbi:MAG: hypothetical protein Dasosvirus12_5 [Dasosvirus sp.]|uniref:Uncharacterized protein n=1 Tax=Dasosvirus sp. TaxID=2487764 RepID=A0A3G4ZVH1_9VIRU|nr:MAG: hypothetical protein Dasosvirus12_5 [Dasosvirus sp.]
MDINEENDTIVSRYLEENTNIEISQKKIEQIKYIESLSIGTLIKLIDDTKVMIDLNKKYLKEQDIVERLNRNIQILDIAIGTGMREELETIAIDKKMKYSEKIKRSKVGKLSEKIKNIKSKEPNKTMFYFARSSLSSQAHNRCSETLKCERSELSEITSEMSFSELYIDIKKIFSSILTPKQKYMARVIDRLNSKKSDIVYRFNEHLLQDEKLMDRLIENAHIQHHQSLCSHNIDIYNYPREYPKDSGNYYYINHRHIMIGRSFWIDGVSDSIVHFDNELKFSLDSKKCECNAMYMNYIDLGPT